MDTTQVNYSAPDTATVRVGIVPRLLAGIVDGVILAVLTWIPTLILAKVSPVLAAVVGGLLGLAYYSLEVLKARSVGKMVLKLTITRQDGTPATRDQLVKRYAFKQAPQVLGILAAVLAFVPLVGLIPFVAILAVLVSSLFMLKPEKLAYHDQLFGTAVFGPAKLTVGVPTAADMRPTAAEIATATA